MEETRTTASGTPYASAMKLLGQPVVTLTQAFHDDHIKTNADARWRAGMDPQIVRRAAVKCCAWCSSLEGTYDYEDVSDTGNDVFRRHENCRCIVDYICDGKAQAVWSKKFFEPDEETMRERLAHRAQTTKKTPSEMDAEFQEWQKQRKENIHTLQEREAYHTSTGDTSQKTLRARSEYGLEIGVANGGERDIIQVDETISLSSHNMHNSSEILYERVKHVQPIEGYDDVFIHGDAWGVATRNADGTEVDIPNDEFIRTLKMLKLENSSIRLCSCSAGEKDRGLASLVAREMNMPVMASTTDVWIDAPNDQGVSEMKLYRDNGKNRPDYNKPGRWRIFMPDGSIKEVKT